MCEENILWKSRLESVKIDSILMWMCDKYISECTISALSCAVEMSQNKHD